VDADGAPARIPGILARVRPLLKPALRRVWRDQTTLQLGLDPERAVAIGGLGPAHATFVFHLDGTRTRAQVLAAAPAVGLSRAEAERLLDLLALAGALDDAAADLSPLATLDQADRDRLGPDLASWSLVRPEPGAAARVLARRRAAGVAVLGSGRVRDALRPLLDAAAVGRARPPSLVVLAADADDGTAGGRQRDRLLADGVPHLSAGVYEGVGRVGPLVLPGRTPCLRCLDLARTDRDPAWPLVAAQLTHQAVTRPGAPATVPCDAVLAATVAAHAAIAVLAHLDDPDAPTWLGGAVLEIRLPHGVPRRRRFGTHPACGCGWPGNQATMAG